MWLLLLNIYGFAFVSLFFVVVFCPSLLLLLVQIQFNWMVFVNNSILCEDFVLLALPSLRYFCSLLFLLLYCVVIVRGLQVAFCIKDVGFYLCWWRKLLVEWCWIQRKSMIRQLIWFIKFDFYFIIIMCVCANFRLCSLVKCIEIDLQSVVKWLN